MAKVSSRKSMLITVKTYPVPATKGVEVSCTAGITEDGQWIRLFPVPFRLLEDEQRFAKYQWITAQVSKAASDTRPESFRLDPDSIVVGSSVSSKNNWSDRKELLAPLVSHCLCCLKQARDAAGAPTLGIFKPSAITGLVVEKDRSQWTAAELGKLNQYPMFGRRPILPLEKIPFKFSYRFRCHDPSCRGHKLMCSDWEMCQAYRSYRRKYGAGWEAKFRQRFERDMIEKNDTHFYVGTVHVHPEEWIIVGLFYPRRDS